LDWLKKKLLFSWQLAMAVYDTGIDKAESVFEVRQQ